MNESTHIQSCVLLYSLGPSTYWASWAFEASLGVLKRAALLISNNQGVPRRTAELVYQMCMLRDETLHVVTGGITTLSALSSHHNLDGKAVADVAYELGILGSTSLEKISSVAVPGATFRELTGFVLVTFDTPLQEALSRVFVVCSLFRTLGIRA